MYLHRQARFFSCSLTKDTGPHQRTVLRRRYRICIFGSELTHTFQIRQLRIQRFPFFFILFSKTSFHFSNLTHKCCLSPLTIFRISQNIPLQLFRSDLLHRIRIQTLTHLQIRHTTPTAYPNIDPSSDPKRYTYSGSEH